mgnify:CR=1 FL=1
MDKKIIKIAIVGPESTGKSTIAEGLAAHYDTFWVPEYSRFYCQDLKDPCTMQDELNMFHGQRALERAIEGLVKNGLLFCDTTFLTVKVWSDYQLGSTPQEVLNALSQHHYDFYLLLKNDIPWQYDPLRDFEGMSDYFMDVWRKELRALNADFVEVGGLECRLDNAIAAVEEFLIRKTT